MARSIIARQAVRTPHPNLQGNISRLAERRRIREAHAHQQTTTPSQPTPDSTPENVVAVFRQLLEAHKKNIRVMVMEELIEECYGPQPLLNGRPIQDVTDFKEWLEKKLSEEQQQAVSR